MMSNEHAIYSLVISFKSLFIEVPQGYSLIYSEELDMFVSLNLKIKLKFFVKNSYEKLYLLHKGTYFW